MYLDVIEHVDATLDPEGKLLTSAIYGKIEELSVERYAGHIVVVVELAFDRGLFVSSFGEIGEVRERSGGVICPSRWEVYVDEL